MDRKLEIKDPVIYTDEHRVDHAAIVTNVWPSMGGMPGCNVVFVSDDDSRTDNYGRQIDRATSVVHRDAQPAGARCWRWPDES